MSDDKIFGALMAWIDEHIADETAMQDTINLGSEQACFGMHEREILRFEQSKARIILAREQANEITRLRAELAEREREVARECAHLCDMEKESLMFHSDAYAALCNVIDAIYSRFGKPAEGQDNG